MKNLTEFLYRYVCPFLAGCFVSGATLMDNTIIATAMVTGSAVLLLASLAFNSRMMQRLRSR